MLLNIVCLKRLSTSNLYEVQDTEFDSPELVEVNLFGSEKIRRRVAIIKAYRKINKGVARNLAYFYFNFVGLNIDTYSGSLKDDLYYLDTYYPELEYGKKYYPCVLREIERLSSDVR